MTKQEFSFAYVKAVCAGAGLSCVQPYDSYSRDLRASSTGPAELDIQVKCTEELPEHDGYYSFPLEVPDYRNLSGPRAIPAILIVVHVPKLIPEWLSQTETELSLRRCGYWVSLRGAPPTKNTETVTVRLPKGQVFTVETPWQIFRDAGFECVP